MKKNLKINFKIILAVIIVLVLISLVISLIPYKAVPTKSTAKYEITKDDIFSISDFNGNDVSVMGIKVGDTVNDVISTLGEPDLRSNYENLVSNFEYSKAIGLKETGLIVSLEANIVTSITIRKPFNKYLVGKTIIDYTKDNIYNIFGIPDKTIFTPIEEGSFVVIRLMRYSNKGIEFIIRKNEVLGFSLYLNDETPVAPGTHETEIVQSPPILIKT